MSVRVIPGPAALIALAATGGTALIALLVGVQFTDDTGDCWPGESPNYGPGYVPGWYGEASPDCTFFAPPEWKARAGLAQAGATPLQLMITTSDRQSLQSGNELVAISGRVINPTDREQQVPPIIAELRDKQSQRVVHRWTIPPPARALAPGTSASFNSAEVDVPKGGDELTVTLGS